MPVDEAEGLALYQSPILVCRVAGAARDGSEGTVVHEAPFIKVDLEETPAWMTHAERGHFRVECAVWVDERGIFEGIIRLEHRL